MLAEQRRFNPLSFFNGGLSKHPHIEKRHKGGEDAAVNEPHIISVCDGVGGWSRWGVDPAKYSNELASHISEVHREKTEEDPNTFCDPKGIMLEAAYRSRHVTGSSTCVMAVVDP